MKINVIGENVLLRLLEFEFDSMNENASKIIVAPEVAKRRGFRYVVVAVGDGKACIGDDGIEFRAEPPVRVDECVIVSGRPSQPIVIGDEKYYIANTSNLLATVEES